ncbi:hypothetical protein MDAP_001806 [Mitosporidium daphniae]|uniref:Peroxisomal membrane protein n=1 Tax=Mitosporidium daphniae TaxID=1485682 RepID=A0A098VQQ5_9MICR|nr:peroxisomal membrane protein [Mitosporidium daphniae]KGG51159.1 peroxisomal membrane protein [Mitosporidium daphniae]|eukprot:XP_013237611.1 peroxisomal membrane protein [Mitosporidium daphniae]
MFKNSARFYNHLLNRYTYPVQMASAGMLWFSGDVLCQYLVWHASSGTELSCCTSATCPECICDSTMTPVQRERSTFTQQIDWPRSVRMTLYGTFFSAPIYTFWFTLLEKLSTHTFKSYPSSVIPSKLLKTPSHLQSAKVSNATSRLLKITAFKTFLDVIVFDPFYLSFFFTVSGCMENRSKEDIKKKLHDELSTTYLTGVAVWLPIQFANFRYIPVPYQPLIVQGVNLFWNSFLSWVQHKESRNH